jgi:hypothetical protein
VLHTASAAFAVLAFCMAALLLAQQAQAQSVPEPPCTTSFCLERFSKRLVLFENRAVSCQRSAVSFLAES